MTCWAVVCETYNKTNLSVVNGIKPFSVRNRLKLQSVFSQETFIYPLFMSAKHSLTLKCIFLIRPRMQKKYNISLEKGYFKWPRSTGLIVDHRVGTKHYHYFIHKPFISPAECRLFININKGIKNTLKEGQYMAVLYLIICK